MKCGVTKVSINDEITHNNTVIIKTPIYLLIINFKFIWFLDVISLTSDRLTFKAYIVTNASVIIFKIWCGNT